jgi:hypothetical protein
MKQLNLLIPASETIPSRHVSLLITTNPPMQSPHLTVTPQRQGVVALPGLSASTTGVVVTMTLVEATRLLAGGSEATGLTVLVDWINDPVDAWVAADGLVLWVNKDDFIVLVGRVLVDPVRVKNAEVGAAATDTLLSGGTE